MLEFSIKFGRVFEEDDETELITIWEEFVEEAKENGNDKEHFYLEI